MIGWVWIRLGTILATIRTMAEILEFDESKRKKKSPQEQAIAEFQNVRAPRGVVLEGAFDTVAKKRAKKRKVKTPGVEKASMKVEKQEDDIKLIDGMNEVKERMSDVFGIATPFGNPGAVENPSSDEHMLAIHNFQNALDAFKQDPADALHLMHEDAEARKLFQKDIVGATISVAFADMSIGKLETFQREVAKAVIDCKEEAAKAKEALASKKSFVARLMTFLRTPEKARFDFAAYASHCKEIEAALTRLQNTLDSLLQLGKLTPR